MKLLRWLAAVGLASVGVCASASGRLMAADSPRPTQGPIVLRDCNIKAVKTARLATDRPGVITAVTPKEGDVVREGQQIVRLMDDVPRMNWEVAKLVADDQVEYEFATKANEVDGHEYIKSVAANRKAPGTISEIELERLKLQEQKSGLQIRKARHDIDVNLKKAEQAKAELDTYRILAPFDGFVSQVLKYKGEAVKQGDTILELVNTDVVHVEGFVKDVDIWRFKKGTPVTVQLAIKGAELEIEKQVFRGKIGFVDAVANATETRVWAEVPNPGNVLRPGFFATMTIFPDEGNAGAAKTRPAPVDSNIAGRGDFRAP
jgi:RND family efflux transporter MFP subunit